MGRPWIIAVPVRGRTSITSMASQHHASATVQCPCIEGRRVVASCVVLGSADSATIPVP